MRRALVLLLIVCLVSCALAGCEKEAPSAPSKQEAVDQAIEEVVLAEYDFDRTRSVPDEYADSDVDYYIQCRTEAGDVDGIVYNYRDLCYDDSRNYRYFDVYSPAPLSKLDPATPVLLYLHGGGWFFGDRHMDRDLLSYIAKTGMVVVSMEYALLCGLNQLPTATLGVSTDDAVQLMGQLYAPEIPVSIADMMDDVRTMLTALSDTFLPAWGLSATKVGLAGYSAGGHLASLYAYAYDDAPLKVGYLLSLVGPVCLIDSGYVTILDKLVGSALFAGALSTCADTLAYILGAEEPLDVTTPEGYEAAMTYLHKVQPVDYVTPDSVPTILCYGGWDGTDHVYDEDYVSSGLFDFEAPSDSLVPVTVYETILGLLESNGVVHTAKLWQDKTHVNAGSDSDSCRWMAVSAAAYAKIYLR